ncbi:hypothetical protein CO678_35050 [Bradyrhizobium diazoefficiens]|uniref:hypothetical protein n=1 Tax=Bradyrhizobium diazoefficiens TaxID=1355477 RepID=UPI000BE9B76A|nr:hypothetical protein [Bradyrhizobium diazoefficiens]PDT57098.1 hypothetical protein CO678_35050 [Bradyrhizobium diazoefficiens]
MNTPERAKGGLYNAVVFGRMITFSLQNLRGVIPDFDGWYTGKQNELRSNALASYFVTLRNSIEKQAMDHTGNIGDIKRFGGSDIAKLGPPPPGATAFFIGDSTGGSGWMVQKPDGSTEPHYIDLPAEIGSVMMNLPNAPGRYRDMPARQLVAEYLDLLAEVVSEARAKFA